MPSTKQEWEKIAEDFHQKWNFPNCIGAIDGKHVLIDAPENCGSEFFNYQNCHSIILMAVADANYKIIYADIGSRGRNNDGGVFASCSFSTALQDNTMDIPPAKPLPRRQKPVPFCIIGDDAFPLKENIMKPFPFRNQDVPQRIYNYRLSRARRVIENTFGILSARFRVLRKNIEMQPDKANYVVAAACVLHNFLLAQNSREIYAPANFVDRETADGRVLLGEWRNEVDAPPGAMRSVPRRSNPIAHENQEEFKEYFMNEGAVDWQYNFI